jgi:hypothetical protein
MDDIRTGTMCVPYQYIYRTLPMLVDCIRTGRAVGVSIYNEVRIISPDEVSADDHEFKSA